MQGILLLLPRRLSMYWLALPLRYPHEPLGKNAPVHASILTPEVVRGDDWRNIPITLKAPSIE
jgi:hypothetical protein